MIVKVTVTGANVVLVNIAFTLPVPLAAGPVTATMLSRVQLYTVPTTLPQKLIVPLVPEQIVCDAGVATAFGIGFTMIVAVVVGPVHVTPALV